MDMPASYPLDINRASLQNIRATNNSMTQPILPHMPVTRLLPGDVLVLQVREITPPVHRLTQLLRAITGVPVVTHPGNLSILRKEKIISDSEEIRGVVEETASGIAGIPLAKFHELVTAAHAAFSPTPAMGDYACPGVESYSPAPDPQAQNGHRHAKAVAAVKNINQLLDTTGPGLRITLAQAQQLSQRILSHGTLPTDH